MQKASWIIIRIHIVILMFVSSYSYAQIYQYQDEEGTIHFSNVPTDKRFKLIDKDKRGSDRVRRKKKIQPNMFHKTINTASKRHKIDPDLIRAVIKAESNFDPGAISPAGAVGLMQLMPRTAEQLNVFDPFDPEENIEAGARYLSYLLGSFDGDLKMSLAAYNAGEDLVRRRKSIPPIWETRNYIKKVLRYYRDFGRETGKGHIYKLVSRDDTIIYTNRPEYYLAYQGYPPER